MKHNVRITPVATILHFLVDGLCACCLYMLEPFCQVVHFAAFILVYNVLAFVSQPITGIMTDILKQKDRMLCGAVVCLSFAVFLTMTMSYAESKQMLMTGFLVSAFLGVGNSLFHVWGGKRIVMQVGNEMRHLGVYVSTGALGLSVGVLFHSWLLEFLLLSAIFFLTVICLFYVEMPDVSIDKGCQSGITPSCISPVNSYAVCLLLLIMLLVSFRSFLGNVVSFTMTKNDTMILLTGIISMLGKMSGGWIAHRLGIAKTFLVSMFIVCICLQMHCGFLNIFAINCTMPITLYWANCLLKGREGLAFGLLALALLPGYYLFYYLM